MAARALLIPHSIGEALELLVLVHAREERDTVEDGNVKLALGTNHGNVCVGVLERLVKVGDSDCLDIRLDAIGCKQLLDLIGYGRRGCDSGTTCNDDLCSHDASLIA